MNSCTTFQSAGSAHELPGNLSQLNPERVYFFAFADDLALFSCNLSRVEVALSKLNSTLPDYGMSVNAGKTCWMLFLPVKSRYHVEEPLYFSLVLNHQRLECVDEFKYMGYILNSFLSSKAHVNFILTTVVRF